MWRFQDWRKLIAKEEFSPKKHSIAYQLRQATEEDAEFIYKLKKLTLRSYVEAIWGWDEAFQRKRFAGSFIARDHQIIVLNQVDIGDLAMSGTTSSFDIDGIFILPQYQGRGIGSHIITDLIREAHHRSEVINLQVFKNNPVRDLYQRLGFDIRGETDTHYLMQKDP